MSDWLLDNPASRMRARGNYISSMTILMFICKLMSLGDAIMRMRIPSNKLRTAGAMSSISKFIRLVYTLWGASRDLHVTQKRWRE